jgi:tRNA dimethylallyltransferase
MERARASRLVVAVYGPTSSGKTRLSVGLCRRLRDGLGMRPVVISADSRQVYRHMDIGTSKTTAQEMQGIRHEMIDVADPAGKFELAEFVRQARGHLADCWAGGGVPVVVGGTSVYVRSLLEGWDVDAVADARKALRKDFPPSMTSDAWKMLARLDRAAAAKVNANNHVGVLNALAQAMAGSAEPDSSASGASSGRAAGLAAGPAGAGGGVRAVVLGVDRPARVIDCRVAETFDRQVQQGLFDEVLALDARYDLQGQHRLQARQATNQVLHTHGYAEWFELAGEAKKSLARLTERDRSVIRERVIERIAKHTRRQRAGFDKFPRVTMVRSTEDAFEIVRKARRGIASPKAPA